MKLSKPTQVRFRPETEKRLRQASDRFGVRPASLVRYAVDTQLAEFERGGKIVIPARQREAAR